MAHVISDECVAVVLAKANVQQALFLKEMANMRSMLNACVDCGACEAACPTGAISEA